MRILNLLGLFALAWAIAVVHAADLSRTEVAKVQKVEASDAPAAAPSANPDATGVEPSSKASTAGTTGQSQSQGTGSGAGTGKAEATNAGAGGAKTAAKDQVQAPTTPVATKTVPSKPVEKPAPAKPGPPATTPPAVASAGAKPKHGARNVTIVGDMNILGILKANALDVPLVTPPSELKVDGDVHIDGSLKTKTVGAPCTNDNDCDLSVNTNMAVSGYLKAKSLVTTQIQSPTKNLTIEADVTVTGRLTVSSIGAPGKDLILRAPISIGGGVRSDVVESAKVIAGSVSTETLSSPSGVVTIDGDLVIANFMTAESLIAEEVHIGGQRQWQLVNHDDFESFLELDQQWDNHKTSSCGNSNVFLGGHCNMGAGDSASKTFASLPRHSHVRLVGNFHFIDSWEGETAFAKLDDQMVWADHHHSGELETQKGMNWCGGPHAEQKMAVPIDVVLPHTGDSVKVSFGSTLDEHACNESWGVDDVQLYVR